LGNTKEALVNLEKAINAGFRNVNHIETDNDLVSLRHLAEYKALIAGLRGAAPEPVTVPAPSPAVVKKLPVNAPVFVPAHVPSAPAVEKPIPSVERPVPLPSAPLMPVFVPAPLPSAPAAVEKPQHEYPQAMQMLADMGFFDVHKNVAALRQTKGEVARAVQILLGENEHAWWH